MPKLNQPTAALNKADESTILKDDDFYQNMDPSLLLTPKQLPIPAGRLFTPIQRKLCEIDEACRSASMPTSSRKGMKSLSYITILANHLVNSTPIKERVATNMQSSTLKISDNIDYIANSIIMSLRDSQVDIGNKTFKFSVHRQKHTIEDITTTTSTKIFKKSKASSLPSLKTYTDIAKKALLIIKQCKIDDKTLANLAIAMSNGIKIDDNVISKKQIEFIAHLNALLFGEEAQRNVSSYIINHMFMDLIANDIFKFSDLPKKLPMAITGAVKASRKLSYDVFKTIKRHTPYDQSERVSDINSSELSELISRSNEVIEKWLVNNGIKKDTLQKENIDQENLLHIVSTIKHAISKWYGFSLKQLPTLENETLDIEISPPSRSSKKNSVQSFDELSDDLIPLSELEEAQQRANTLLIGDLFDSD